MHNAVHFAIVDEVDSILIDEARTPLIISGPAEDSSQTYLAVNDIPAQLTRQDPITNDEGKPDFGPGDYAVDEKAKQIFLSDDGHEKVEEILSQKGLLAEGESLYDSANIMLMHHVMAALRAHVLFTINVDYIVRDGQIVIVDEFTGRTMPGRRWSEGLHQAVEAKEGVPIQHEKPNAGIYYVPELLPSLRKALRYDWYGGYRSLRVPADLRSWTLWLSLPIRQCSVRIKLT